MNYAISKPEADGRHWTCSFNVEDGTVLVIDLTKENSRHLQLISDRGYVITETDLEPGIYAEDEFFENHGRDGVSVDVPPQAPAGTRKAPAKKKVAAKKPATAE